MKWPGPLVEARFLKRYKRFLADFSLADGTLVTAHCANTGSMATCMEPGAPAWLTHHDDPKRKLKYSWQAMRMPDGWVGINTAIANHLVAEAIRNGIVPQLTGYSKLQQEKKYGKNSRIDLLLSAQDKPSCYVEVKNVTLRLGEGTAAFPDAVTARGTKHLEELAQVAAAGERAVLFFCVQRENAQRVVPAEEHDPVYAKTLRHVVTQGVEVLAYRACFDPSGIHLNHPLPVTFT